MVIAMKIKKKVKAPNPPKGNFSKAFTAKFEKYYKEAYDKYKDKKKASIIAWSRIKHRYMKSEKSGKWILKKK
jgi:cation transport regulator ChaB